MLSKHGGYSYASWKVAATTALLKAAGAFCFQYIQSFLLQECHNNLVSPFASLQQTTPEPHTEKTEPGRTVYDYMAGAFHICALVLTCSGPEATLPVHPLALLSWCRRGIWCRGAALPFFWCLTVRTLWPSQQILGELSATNDFGFLIRTRELFCVFFHTLLW